MIRIDLQGIDRTAPHTGISRENIWSWESQIGTLQQQIFARGQGFLDVMDDQEMLDSITQVTAQVKIPWNTMILLGIGGSSLGTEALHGALGSVFPGSAAKQLLVMDNIDPAMIQEVTHHVDLRSAIILVITKSGSTPETMAQFLYFEHLLQQQGLDPRDHLLCITDPHQGALRQMAHDKGYHSLSVPANVGGRFSVLTSVGLLPATLLGYDIQALLDGASYMKHLFLQGSMEHNLPMQLAACMYEWYRAGYREQVLFTYAQQLRMFGGWYRQLIAESLGKAVDREGNIVHHGITPIPAIGVSDQHSQLQLYNEGPHTKAFLMVEVETTSLDIAIPRADTQYQDLAYFGGATFEQLFQAEYQGTCEALIHHQRPLVQIALSGLGERQLGALFMLFQCATALVGEMLGIDTYNQPGVEYSKQVTKSLLQGQI